jgi:predicted CoA-substrate-specific enzyme activase
MIGYLCKYAPVEILEAFGETVQLLEPHVTDFARADSIMHANICSFTKAALEEFDKGAYDGLILTSCCDSGRRLYDVLKEHEPDRFIYCLDLPHKINEFTVSLYEEEFRKLIRAYEAYSGKTFSADRLRAICSRKREAALLRTAPRAVPDLKVALVGARPGSDIKSLIANHNTELTADLTCTGTVRSYQIGETSALNDYSFQLLNQLPCMRMAHGANRERFLETLTDRIDGIIYHTIQFCDIYSYEYSRLKELRDIPILKLETDATAQSSGQILTRLEAFLEALRAQKGSRRPAGRITVRKEQPMYVMGIDSGSTSTNAVIINEKKQILASAVRRTGAKSGESADMILEEVLKQAGISRDQLASIVSTGYGRVSIPFADRSITEISCHGKGARFLNPSVHTILDIGGQDSKAIRLNKQGDVADFVMNDKCAAGTGRFLEMMARTLELDINELGPISLNWKEEIQISSMCSVFAESEVISLIAQNKDTADIAHGIHEAIVGRALSLMKRVGLEPGFMMTGGVARNPGVVKVLEQRLGASVCLCAEPEIVGALGAALYALEKDEASA